LADENGTELDMGTGFDFFGPEAAPYYFEEHEGNKEARENRKLLRNAMFEEEFTINNEEWWHFDYGNQVWAFEAKKPFAFFGEARIQTE
jgi:D-alanyl-D-alanine dipeptidase